MFNNRTLINEGGTGSCGNAILRRFLNSKVKEVRIFNREKIKQYGHEVTVLDNLFLEITELPIDRLKY
tara:strand:- start:729 stop:932 length:204 start_codon:yes stop_codon:yes gene_type:complete